ncbi:hypothetical protein QFZ57_004334 [Arthrobacter sp. B1I2]|nr:hypothetical protein [Arthrobacter sp. B1I2]
MTAEGLLVPVVSAIAGFIGFMAVPLLGFALLRMIGGSR